MKITRAKLVTKQRLGLPLELKVKVSIYKHKNRRQKITKQSGILKSITVEQVIHQKGEKNEILVRLNKSE